MSERWLVSVGAGAWQLSGIRAAQQAGIRVLAVDGADDAPGFAIADRCATVDIRDPDAVVQAVREQAVEVSGAASFVTDAGMVAAARVRELWQTPGPRQLVTERLTNKCQQRAVWTEAGLPCPLWFSAATVSEASAAIDAIAGKAIIKPADSAGSRGIHVIEQGEAWQTKFEQSLCFSTSGSCIVESFIVGTEFAVETFAHRGRSWVLAVSEKRKVAGTNDTVAQELATSALDTESIATIGRLAVDALKALGHTDGPGHTEILRQPDGSLWLVEAAGRGGGFMVADGIVPRASGFDLARATALQAVGLTPDPPPEERLAFVLRFLPSRKGVVKRIGGFDRANAIAKVECRPLVDVGDIVEDARTDGARLAYIFACAPDRSEAMSKADAAEACLEVVVV